MRLILLTEPVFFDVLAAPLRAAGADVVLASTLPALQAALTTPARVLSIGSDVIVPAALLTRLAGPAYNLHPGPPAYPGLFPSVFALYEGAARFGVTLHEMAAAVDAGPIVAVDEFALDPAWDRLALDTTTFAALQKMLQRFAPQLAGAAPLSRSKHTWTGPKRTRKEFEALCHLPDGVTAEEFARRYKAIGEGPEHAITLSRFGRTFRLDSGKRGEVVRGGQLVGRAN